MKIKRFRNIIIIIVVILGIFIYKEHQMILLYGYKNILGDHSIPAVYYPIYQSAAEEYGIPWELLAAVHRVETVFSLMDPLVSPVGALGPFQFMPRTWVGWSHPGSALGKIEDNIDITSIELIRLHSGYGIDANGDGIADPFEIEDATFAAAKYLSDHGAANGDIEKALFAYNRSNAYVDEVLHYYEAYIRDYRLMNRYFID
ncbi:lytic transglycosylase domain-containing protein [Anaerobacillus isosaccharinicus]|uniref:Lytic transglycosylase domain-containing protein n=1 Tax=Anaerobacillus isosaccharinicus TaxID=1532552 RepID=A0A7S7RCD1_9BACI|nr:lytic transglycosylase domain-containing protein [Anaerobacillus isosaccharinicus]